MAYTFKAKTNTLAVFVNGKLLDSMQLSSVDLSHLQNDDLFLGGQAPYIGINVYQYPFDGALDEVRIYDRALNGLEIYSVMLLPF